ncbi:hypothetical protein [Massilia sp. PWRC2]|uniref:hypothetical protein n=1 Tax=Massilia sp. PWRC2 TaxID=2804626 RepID=UPI003CF77236
MHEFEEAIRNLVSIVNAFRQTGTNINAAPAMPAFSYLLTPKQRERIAKICAKEGWAPTKCGGVEINASTVDHILDSRLAQGVSEEFVADILVAAYNQFSEIHVNTKYKKEENKEQAFFLNGIKKLKFGEVTWNAVAVVALENLNDAGERQLASITAYHADEAKVRKIKGLPKAKK